MDTSLRPSRLCGAFIIKAGVAKSQTYYLYRFGEKKRIAIKQAFSKLRWSIYAPTELRRSKKKVGAVLSPAKPP